MLTFPSKIDTWLGVILIGSALACAMTAGYMLSQSGRLEFAAALTVLLGSVLPIWLMLTTNYTLTNSELVVRSGPFRWRVPIDQIRDVRPTRNPLSSPALSLDRIRIDYGRRAIMISPRDKERFLRELATRRQTVGTASSGVG